MRRQVIFRAAAAAAVVLGTASMTAAPSLGARHPASAASTRDGRIAYADFSVGRVATVNPDGSAIRFVTPRGDFAADPAWSPDGSRIVYASDRAGQDLRLFTIRRDGTGVHQVTSDAAGFQDQSPTFTPDGARIVYTRCRPDPPGGCALEIVRTDGTGKTQLTPFSHDPADFFADVSPDGRHVAFARFGGHGIIWQVWVMRIDGSEAHPVTRPGLEASAPAWTPDGRHLLVTSSFSHVKENIYRIDADGSHLEQLTHSESPHNAFFSAPSPSGSRIAYVDDRAYPQIDGGDLFVMSANGGRQHPVVTTSGLVGKPDWGTAPLLTGSTSDVTSPRPPAPHRTRVLPTWLGHRLHGFGQVRHY